ncbi:MAG: N-acetylmuramoyl-L-alanine amidase, partial [Pseudomonadota bacterium]
VIRFAGMLEYSYFTLAEPNRLVIDFSDTQWKAPFDNVITSAAIEDLRFGYFRPGQTRLVIDLSGPYAVTSARTREEDAESVLTFALKPVEQAFFTTISGWPDGARWEPPEVADPLNNGTDIIVAIDPGHGGFDPGANADGLLEKDVVLAVGLTIAERVDREPGFKAVLTRHDDSFVPLRGRLQIAHRAGANVFISLHADSITLGKADGVSIYTLSETASDQAARDFAERENRVDVLAGADLVGEADDVAHLLFDLSRRGTGIESDRLARLVLSSFDGTVKTLGTRPYRQAGFYVLKSLDIPSLLIELGFLSSEEDRERLTNPAFATAVAQAIVNGLVAWRKVADPAFLAPRN